MANKDIPSVILEHLQRLEPGEEFLGVPPQIRSSSGKSYFVKQGRPDEAEQYIGEVESLKAIGIAAPEIAPRVLASGVEDNGKPFFVSEYKDLSRLSEASGKALAKRLATELHAQKSRKGFGFHVPTFCGATKLKNGWFDSWEACFSFMIGDMLSQLERKGSYREFCSLGERVRQIVIPNLLGPLVVDPVLLHGDLWSGNVGVDQYGKPVIFDPSSFYGHNEADLAISRMFGGFSSSFYTTYHEFLPKSDPIDQFQYRCELYEMFHYLNHTLLFGGGYEQSAKKKMMVLLNWADNNSFA